MEKDIALFEELLLNSPEIKYPRVWDVVPALVVKIEKKNILVNVNNQFSWIVVSKEIWNTVSLDSISVGDSIEVMVLWDNIEKGLLILSLKRANQIKSLSNLQKYYSSEEVIKVKATEANKWWLLVDIDGLKWFIPVSQLSPINYPRVEWADPAKILEHLEWLVWKEFKVKVINVDEVWKKIIFSERAAFSNVRDKALSKLKVWDVIEWTVSWILSYWLFVTFDWLEGLVHVSEIDWGHVNNPAKFAKVWQKLKVKVIGLDGDKISLSIKRLQENPWEVISSKYKLWDVIKAPVIRVSQFWAFVELEGGIQGLIHLSEISHWVVKDIRDFVKVWEEVSAKIINFEPNEKRIWLSLKALQEPPKDEKGTEKESTKEQKVEDKEDKKEDFEIKNQAETKKDEENKDSKVNKK